MPVYFNKRHRMAIWIKSPNNKNTTMEQSALIKSWVAVNVATVLVLMAALVSSLCIRGGDRGRAGRVRGTKLAAHLKIFPWLKARPCLSLPTHLKYWSTNALVESSLGSSFVQV